MQLEPLPALSDYHIHSIFSDGADTYCDIVRFAASLNLQVIAICDHSDEYMQHYNFPGLGGYKHALHRWQNVINEVRVIRGLELDLLSPQGEISKIDLRHRPEFLILSVHKGIYKGSDDSVTDAYLRAIDAHAKEINLIGHPCANYFGANWEQGIDVERLVSHTNDADIGIEINGINIVQKKENLEKVGYVCRFAKSLYANSDAHTLSEMKAGRSAALNTANSYDRFEDIPGSKD